MGSTLARHARLRYLAIIGIVLLILGQLGWFLLFPPLTPAWGHAYAVALHRYLDHPTPEARAIADAVRRDGQARERMHAVAVIGAFIVVDVLIILRYRRWSHTSAA